MGGIPIEARRGLTRAWLSILAERHPNATWVAVEHDIPLEAANVEDCPPSPC
jgi:hypothetical protein